MKFHFSPFRFVSYIFPDYCFLCKKALKSNEYILCNNCVLLIEPVPLPRCKRCGYPQVKVHCPRCRQLKPVFQQAYQLFVFSESIRSLIHLWKYSEQIRLTEYFSHLFMEFSPPSFLQNIDLIAWVPHKTLIYRGYNQSRLLADNLAQMLNCEICPENSLKKIKKTPSQTSFHSFFERKKNISACFQANNPLLFEGRNVLIVDDVMTSGNTLNELSRVICEFKPESVKTLTIALAHNPA